MGEQEKVIVHSARGRRGLLRAFASGTSCPKSHEMCIDASKSTVSGIGGDGSVFSRVS